jgi:protein associated with RNAse G/E
VFPRPESTTTNLTLGQYIELLKSNGDVAAIVLGGSAATGMNPHSDIDIAIIVDTDPCPARTGTAWVDGRLADLGFASVKQVIAALSGEQAERRDNWLEIIAVGKVVYDRDSLFSEAPEPEPAPRTSRAELFERWDHASYNVEQSRRYVKATDPLYHDALRLRMTYQLSDMMLAYFSLRHLPWRGEKAAIRYWESHDPEFKTLFLGCLAEQNLEHKFELYEEVVRRAVAPVGEPWRAPMVGVTPAAGFDQVDALRFYQLLVGALPKPEEPVLPRIRVRATNWDGDVHWEHGAWLVSREDGWVVTRTEAGTRVRTEGGGEYVSPFDTRAHYWSDRWFNVIRLETPGQGLYGYYCNIATPLRFDGETVHYVDLQLDVRVFADGAGELEYLVVDEEEFEAARERYGYGDDTVASARAAVGELVRMIEAREFPFDG